MREKMGMREEDEVMKEVREEEEKGPGGGFKRFWL